MTWITAAKKAATGCSPALGKAGIRSFSDQSRLAQELIGPGQTSLSAASAVKPTLAGPKAAEVARTMSSSSAARMKKKALDRVSSFLSESPVSGFLFLCLYFSRFLFVFVLFLLC